MKAILLQEGYPITYFSENFKEIKLTVPTMIKKFMIYLGLCKLG